MKFPRREKRVLEDPPKDAKHEVRSRPAWLNFRTLWIVGLLVFVLGVVGASSSRTGTLGGSPVTVYEALSALESGEVVAARTDVEMTTIQVELNNGEQLRARLVEPGQLDLFAEAGVVPTLGADESNVLSFRIPLLSVLGLVWVPAWVLLLAVGATLLIVGFVLKRIDAKDSTPGRERRFEGSGGHGGSGMARMPDPEAERPTTRFSDVAGCDEAVEDAQDVVAMLENREAFTRLGARTPRGVLLVGPPGVGKTLLARAIAGESQAAFFAVSGSEFVEVFVGVGPSRVRALFAAARNAGRAVVFIDEIDAVGKSRSSTVTTGGQSEYESTLNQLLVEMDGFSPNDEIIVVAATNRPETLDPALLRSGRFDRKVFVPLPDLNGRRAILRAHLSGKALDPDADLDVLAARCQGMSGADLANVVNEAAILAAKDGSETLTQQHLNAASRDQMAGRELVSRKMSVDQRRLVAWHEAGHAICAATTVGAQPPEFVTIVARGVSGGTTWMKPREGLLTRSAATADLVVMLGGRAAEELLLDGDYTSGAAGDLDAATDLARKMVLSLGMGPTLATRDAQAVAYHHGGNDPAVENLLTEALESARACLSAHRTALEAMVESLLLHERLEADEITELVRGE
jgi:cell division protease FtsH